MLPKEGSHYDLPIALGVMAAIGAIPPDAPLAPWEQSPSAFAAAPVPKAPPPWPLSSTGPMYVWNPDATTGPLRRADEEEDQEP